MSSVGDGHQVLHVAVDLPEQARRATVDRKRPFGERIVANLIENESDRRLNSCRSPLYSKKSADIQRRGRDSAKLDARAERLERRGCASPSKKVAVGPGPLFGIFGSPDMALAAGGRLKHSKRRPLTVKLPVNFKSTFGLQTMLLVNLSF